MVALRAPRADCCCLAPSSPLATGSRLLPSVRALHRRGFVWRTEIVMSGTQPLARGSGPHAISAEPLKEAVGRERVAVLLPSAGVQNVQGVDYPAVATGKQNFVMFWRAFAMGSRPWIFAAVGGLAGGRSPRCSRYDPSDQRPGLLAAQNRDVWETVRRGTAGQLSSASGRSVEPPAAGQLDTALVWRHSTVCRCQYLEHLR